MSTPRPAAASSPAAVPVIPDAVREVLAALPEAAVVTRGAWAGGGAEIILVNEAFCALTGYSAAELVGQNTRLLHGPRTTMSALVGKAGGVAQSGENWAHRKDGRPFFASWSFRPLGPELMIGVYRDLSEMLRYREAMIQSQKLDTVGQLAGGVAHDFNNLLSIINGYCEILSGKLADRPQAQRELQEIHRAGLKAAGIARQMLEFSRRQETEVRVVNANTLVREIADILRRVLGEMVRVEFRLASDLGNVRIDPTQFQQVLLNLCFNARDAMPGGGKLVLRTFNREITKAGRLEPGDYVGFEVKDSGEGMDEETQRRIFEPFFTTKANGTGLGLAMVRNIIVAAGGEITVSSKAGAGTTFEVLLPETPEPEQSFSTALPALSPGRGSETVWLIEPDDVLRKMVSGVLAVDGYRVVELKTVADGLAAGPKTREPDVVLLDCGAADACRLVEQASHRNPRLKVLALSVESPAGKTNQLPARSLGHLPKPFTISTLLRTLRGLLDNTHR